MRPIGDHFYTASQEERDNAVARFGYESEGVAFWAPMTTNSVPLHRLYNPDSRDHFYTSAVQERDNAVARHGYRSEGIACQVFATAVPDSSPLHRLYNPASGDHFYTTSAQERDNAVARFGYRSEGIVCHVYSSSGHDRIPIHRLYRCYGARVCIHLKVVQRYISEGITCHVYLSAGTGRVELHRLYSRESGDHFYTTSAQERDNAVARFGYVSEGVVCWVLETSGTGTTPLHRLYNPGSGDHFYTTSAQEHDNAVARFGYRSEGIACQVLTTAVPGSLPLHRLYNPESGDHFYTTSAQERDNAVANTGPNTPIDTMVQAMQTVYRSANILVEVGSRQYLGLTDLVDLDAGSCLEGVTTSEQNELFKHRDGVGDKDIAIYFVRTTVPAYAGCAAHPPNRPSAVVAQGASPWTLAHEVGHVLGLAHISDEDCSAPGYVPTRLMTGCGTGLIVGTPTLGSAEMRKMDDSPLTADI